jgi:murein DD-endopeptidase MepM/ murein hydrolase activator NlpD
MQKACEMDRLVKLALIAFLGAPLLAACTPDTPETAFRWDANDRLAHHSATASRQTARTYVYEGDNYAVPAPKPRPAYTPAKAAPQQSFFDRRIVAPTNSSMAFAWPASGKVIANFGAAPNGERNDGINIAVPQGAPIRAAASGTVSYSGDELKDYGNLLLIQHDGGYVTAYAHAQQLLVQKGEFVAKGQVIAYAGHTGDVTTPQLHFEIRHGTIPVNPDTFLTQRNS